VLEIDPRDLSAFCGFEDAEAMRELDARLTQAVTMHVKLCGEEDNGAWWLYAGRLELTRKQCCPRRTGTPRRCR